jgi:hypothetical protein
MKKLYISLAIIMVSVAVTAQETGDTVLRSKKGIPILPQKGDWAIGASALPVLDYLGNIFNNTQNNTLNLGSQTIYGRYFIANNAAVRFAFSFNNTNNLFQYYVRDDAAFFNDPLSREQTIDTYNAISMNYDLDLGYQKFRGYGRLKGFYGVNVGFSISRTQSKYTYGNPITQLNPTPTTGNGGANIDGSRTLETDNGVTKAVRAGLIGGVEYYFAPKICIGGELTLAFQHSWKSQGDAKFEKLSGTLVDEYNILNSPKGRVSTTVYTFAPVNFGGSLYLMFHF